MRYSTETFTPLIKSLQGLNEEIRLRLSSMPSSMGQEMESLGQWLEEMLEMVQNLDNDLCLISHHLQILNSEYRQKLEEDS